jgi:pSer/pThr/pTyr-binding forkhead associated (FHA) protein
VSEAQLNILNYALLALLYLFFGRVLWAVWAEVRGPRAGHSPAMARTGGAPTDPTVPADRTDTGGPTDRPAAAASAGKRSKSAKASKGVPTKLSVLEPKVRRGTSFAIGHEVLLGRADSCGIGLPDDTFASTLHARVYTADGGVVVDDLGSTNGTHVNGARVDRPTPLSVGDRLQVGSTVFEAR